MYRSVQHIITAYLKKYTLGRAIQRARQERATSRTPEGFDLWDQACSALEAMRPKKQFKHETKGE